MMSLNGYRGKNKEKVCTLWRDVFSFENYDKDFPNQKATLPNLSILIHIRQQK